MLFTCAYCFYTAMLARMLRASEFNAAELMKLIRGIVYAFFIVLIVQQICVLFGMPVFCPAMVYQNPWKLNSLTAEPSHTSITLCFLMFSYMQTLIHDDTEATLIGSLRKDWKLWGAWMWTIFTTFNASAFVFAPVALLPFITRKNIYRYCGAAIVVVAIVAIIPEGTIGNLDRVKKFSTALITTDPELISESDPSIASRILPTLWGAEALTLDKELITGHGVDASIRDIEDIPNDGFEEKGSAGIFNMLYNYGLPAAFFLIYSIVVCVLVGHSWATWVTLIFAIFLSAEYNMQLLWLVMAYGMVYKYNIVGFTNTKTIPVHVGEKK